MQLHENIPTLGGLSQGQPPPRREELAREGERALGQIEAVLGRAKRRVQMLAALRVLCVLAAGLLVAVLAGALLAPLTASLAGRVVAGVLVAFAVAAAALFVLRSPLQRAASNRRRLARVLGGPSELLSSVELASEASQGAPHAGMGSPSIELLALLHVRAARAAQAIDLSQALPVRTLRWPLLAFCGALVLWAAVFGFKPQLVRQGLLRLWRGDDGLPAAELSPIAGDLSITYLYPAYTGLPPRTEEGTAGDLRAPRGTQIRLAARADRDLAQAFAVLNGQAVQLEAQGPGHRQLSGGFTLSQSGTWSLRFGDSRGRSIAQGPSRPVEIVADAAPQAQIDEPKQAVLEVDPQGLVPISWAATDDYGLSQVALVFQKPGAKEVRIVLEAPQAKALRLRGAYSWQLSPLSLRAGDKVSYHLEALDNDAVDGPQKGVSATQAIKIFSAAEHSREALIHAQALWERLVALLADRLEEKPAPDSADAATPWYAQTSQKDKDGRQLVNELSAASIELLKDKLAPKAVGRALKYAASGLSPVLQRTSLSRAPLSQGGASRTGDQRALAFNLANEIKEEEKDVLYLQDLLDKARLDAMQELGKELAGSRRELARLAEKLRKANDDETKNQLLSEVERMREHVQQLMQRMSELAKGIQDEHLNQEAQQSVEKEQDLLSQLSDIQKKLQSGKVDEALKELDKLSQQIEKLENELQKNAGQQQSGQYAEEAKALQQAADELKDLQGKEQDLEKRTAQLRREEHEKAQKKFEQRGGKDLAKKLHEKAEEARKAIQQIDPKIAEQLGLEDTLDQAQERASDTSRALQLSDFDEALDAAQRAERAVAMLQGRLAMEDQVAQRYPNFARNPAGVRKSLQSAANAQQPLQQIVQDLMMAMPREGQDMSPEQQARMKGQAREQAELQGRLGKVREQLSKVGEKVPIFGPQHEQMLQEAQQGMGNAQQKLDRGEPRGAQAGEEQALEKLSQFQDAMEKLAKQSKGQGGQGQGLPMPWGEPSGNDGEGDQESSNDSQSMRHDKVEIPDAESSRAPAEFRKELLDAMKQAPPQSYKERVKQYYEELVK
jgi:hypothetical protein